MIDNKKVKDLCISVIGDIKFIATAYAGYVAETDKINKMTDYTEEYRRNRRIDFVDAMLKRLEPFFNTLDTSTEQIRNQLIENNSTFDFTNPDFAGCVALLAAAEKPLPHETIHGIKEKFIGNRQALIALGEIAKGGNREILSSDIPNTVGMAENLMEEIVDLRLEFPKNPYRLRTIRDAVIKLAAACGEDLTEEERDCGTDMQVIVNLQMRAIMGI